MNTPLIQAKSFLAAVLVALGCLLSPQFASAKPYPRLIKNAFMEGCNQQCATETDDLIKTSCFKACDCSMTKLQDRFSLEEFIIYLDDESAKTEPGYPELDKRAKAVTDECVTEVLEKNRLGAD